MNNGHEWMDRLAELRREAGVPEVAHSCAYGRSPLTLVEDLFDQGLAEESPFGGRITWYLVEYHITAVGVPTGTPYEGARGTLAQHLAALSVLVSTPYEFERYLMPLDWHIDRALPLGGCVYRRYGGKLFVLVEHVHLDWVLHQVGRILDFAGVQWRRKVRRLGRRRVVVLGLSVNPATGSIGLPKRTRRRLRALERAEAAGSLPPGRRRVLQGLRSLQRALAWRTTERAWEAWVPARSET